MAHCVTLASDIKKCYYTIVQEVSMFCLGHKIKGHVTICKYVRCFSVFEIKLLHNFDLYFKQNVND